MGHSGATTRPATTRTPAAGGFRRSDSYGGGGTQGHRRIGSGASASQAKHPRSWVQLVAAICRRDTGNGRGRGRVVLALRIGGGDIIDPSRYPSPLQWAGAGPVFGGPPRPQRRRLEPWSLAVYMYAPVCFCQAVCVRACVCVFVCVCV